MTVRARGAVRAHRLVGFDELQTLINGEGAKGSMLFGATISRGCARDQTQSPTFT
ncbi:hypothetical protein [Burkholderia sp. F1]|uniref:hypothetical protein n=1 Tax=Burkholderia sp. F1 TaxID=3366817 RepID=UPI003D7622E9